MFIIKSIDILKIKCWHCGNVWYSFDGQDGPDCPHCGKYNDDPESEYVEVDILLDELTGEVDVEGAY